MSRNGMKSLLDEIGTMAEMQKKGDSEWFIPLDKLEGEFRQVASVVNEMVKFNIDTSLKILHVVASYGKGDFTAILDDMPGKQKIANEKLNLLRSSLVGVLADANILSKAAVEGKLATRADASKHEGDFRKIVEGVNDTLDAVIGPLNVAAEYVDRISKGDIPPRITDNYNGDFNEIKNNLNNCIDIMNNLLTEAGRVVTAAADGQLGERANADLFVGGWNKLVVGVNEIVTNIVNPLMVTADYVDKVSKGVIPPAITDEYKGQYNVIKGNLNAVVKMMSELLAETDKIIKAAADGQLDERANADLFVGGWNKLVAGVNDTITNIVNPLMVTADYVDKISKGDIPAKITDIYKGQYNIIKSNLNTCIDAVNALVADADLLSVAAVAGKLATRADASKHQGDFRKIVQGVNDTLDAVIGPLNVSAEYVDRISKGDIPPVITDNYNGDFNEIKTNLNNCIGNINALVSDAGMLVDAAVEGKLATRADASKHQGDYRRIVEGVNQTLDAVIGPLNVSAEYVDRISKGDIPPVITDNYNGDFNEIKNNLNMCIGAVNALVADANLLSQAAVEGKLATRADATKHQGDYRKIVEGVNQTFDAVIGPLNVAAEYVDRISKGDIPPRITDNYNGDFNEIKNNLNNCIDIMNNLLKEAGRVVTAAADGQLDERANADLFVGGWNKLVVGVNEIVTNIVNPLMVTADYVDKVSKGVIPPAITDEYKGQYNVIKGNLNAVVKMMSELLAETDKIIKAAADGELDERADADHLRGWLEQTRCRSERDHHEHRQPPDGHGRLRGQDIEGHHPARDHRRVQGPVQCHQGQPQRRREDDERASRRDGQDHQGSSRRRARQEGRRIPLRGWLEQARCRSQRHHHEHRQPPDGHGRLRGQDQQRGYPGEDHRQLQRPVQYHQEQPQYLYRRGERAGGRCEHPLPGGSGR